MQNLFNSANQTVSDLSFPQARDEFLLIDWREGLANKFIEDVPVADAVPRQLTAEASSATVSIVDAASNGA